MVMRGEPGRPEIEQELEGVGTRRFVIQGMHQPRTPGNFFKTLGKWLVSRTRCPHDGHGVRE